MCGGPCSARQLWPNLRDPKLSRAGAGHKAAWHSGRGSHRQHGHGEHDQLRRGEAQRGGDSAGGDGDDDRRGGDLHQPDGGQLGPERGLSAGEHQD